MDAMRAMLDELMGKERNKPLTERSQKTWRWDDPSTCKYQLCGVCPYKLFKNTKSDLGTCEYETHDDHLDWPTIKADYEKAQPRDVERYERKLMKFLEDLIRDMDRKIAKNKERAEKESAPRELTPADQVKLAEIKQRAKEALEKAEALAEAGEVDQAQMQQQQADAYNKQHDELHAKLTMPEKTMIVCEICGVFINSTDNEQRRKDHLEGKQYLGWKAIREKYAELLAKFGPGGAGPARGASAGPDALPPPPGREDSSRDRRDRSRERERDRDRDGRRDRDYRTSDRDRDGRRDRDRDYYERDRDAGRRERDYGDRDRYDRDASRRDRDRDYRDFRETDRRRY